MKKNKKNFKSPHPAFSHLLRPEKVKKGFTLAEVLITMAIIGVVAAMTIPTLVLQNQQRGWNTASTLFERRLEEALKIMNTQQVLSGYKSTETFMNELSKHMKFTKTCTNDKITDCFSDKVYWGSEEKEVDMSKIKTTIQFGISDWNTKLVAADLVDGVSAIFAYNPKCKQNPFSNDVNVFDCVAVLYDVSGYANPNTYGKDLRAIHVDSLDGACGFKMGGKCATPPMKTSSLAISQAECEKLVDKGLLQNCPINNDAYAGAVKYCDDMGKKLPSKDDLNKLSQDLYNTPNIRNGWHSGLTLDQTKKELYGFGEFVTGSPLFMIWTDLEDPNNTQCAYYWAFYNNAIYYHSHNGRSTYYAKDVAVCVDK